MLLQRVPVGEETGALDAMLEKVAAFHEREAEALVDRLTAVLEPLLTIVLRRGRRLRAAGGDAADVRIFKEFQG